MALLEAALVTTLTLVVAWAVWKLAWRKLFHPDCLKGKAVVVTGASSGIGEQLAYCYSRLGAHVVVTARREDLLKKVVEKCRELGAAGGTYDYVVADMGKSGEASRFLKEALSILGKLDHIVINHAYVIPLKEWSGKDKEQQDLHKTFDVNFYSYVEVASAALPHLKASQGCIGVVSSSAGKIPGPYLLPYGSSKFALSAFFAGLREELILAKEKVSITVGHFGLIDTAALSTMKESEGAASRFSFEHLTKMMPPATPEDTAHALVEAITIGQQDLYYPASHGLYPTAVLYALWPRLIMNAGHLTGVYKQPDS